MGSIQTANPVKLFMGIIFAPDCDITNVVETLEKRYSNVCFKSTIWDFSHTNYYEKEMGTGLRRMFVAFDDLISPESLNEIKIFTNDLEDLIAEQNNTKIRIVNLDPGYLDLAKVILASTKDYAHRIYIGKGIYAEIEMFFQKKKYCFHSWTYPDYQRPEYVDFFIELRKIYKKQIEENLL